MRKIFIAVLCVFTMTNQTPLHNMDVQQEQQAQQAQSTNIDLKSGLRSLREYAQNNRGTVVTTGPTETQQVGLDMLERGEWPEIGRQIAPREYSRPTHSEAIIALDAQDNVAAVSHTINADHWENSGIFVDGVSIPGAGYFQQQRMDKIGPGAHLSDTINPVLVCQNGLPVYASSCIGSDLHSATVQNLYNQFNFDMPMSESRATPKIQSVSRDNTLQQKVQYNQFSQNLLDAVRAMGLDILLVTQGASEYWIGLRIRH